MDMSKARVIPDQTYPGMYRLTWSDGRLSDMVNLSRANDAAACFNESSERQRRAAEPRRDSPMSLAGNACYPTSPTPMHSLTAPSSIAA